MKVKIDIYSERCCDICNEIIHNHISECPVCKNKNAPTENYGELEPSDVLECKCGAKFKLISEEGWYYENVDAETIEDAR